MQKITVMLFALLTALNFSACGTDSPAKTDKIKVVATIFPIYDWSREIIGENDLELTLLMDKGVDLHSFQPSAQDILKISDCDMFIYVGGESDEWVEDTLKEAKNKNMVVLNLMDELGDKIKLEEHVEGMEGKNELENDEHIWLSLKNAQILCDLIENALEKVDSAHADAFKINNDAYKAKLAALDEKYRQIIDSAQENTLLFGDRFPFRYLVDDYGLNYYAAFAGCSAETEASFQTISFLAKKVDGLKLSNILTIEGSNHKIAETIIQNTADKSQKILILNSMQGKIDGETYLSVMETNLSVLQGALK